MGTVQTLTHAPAMGGSTPLPQLMLAGLHTSWPHSLAGRMGLVCTSCVLGAEMPLLRLSPGSPNLTCVSSRLKTVPPDT